MGLHLLQRFNRWFTLAAFGSYLVAFALAFTMVIVFFPVGAFALLFAGIFMLPVVVFVSLALGAWERAWSRRWLRTERCPACGAAGAIRAWTAPSAGARETPDDVALRNPDERPRYECGRCGAFFADSGEGVESPTVAA